MHLVIGGRGLIGSAVCRELQARDLPFIATTRDGSGGNTFKLDLGDFDGSELPWLYKPNVTVYLIAAIPGFVACKGNPVSWIVNRDAPIAIARCYRRYPDAFIVFISSDVVNKEYDIEYSAYPRQKAEVESYIQAIDGAIVRPGKVATDRASELAKVIVEVGIARRPGLTRWT
jgi:nucleoside-diphosphate-sugar epimerase